MSDPALTAAPDPAPILADPALFQPATPAPAQSWALSPTVPTDGPTAAAGISQYAGDVGTAVAGLIPWQARSLVYSLGYFLGAALGAVAVLHPFPTLWDYAAGLAAASIFSFSHALALANVTRPAGK